MPWSQLELPFAAPTEASCRYAVFTHCPMCDGPLTAEHAHYRCTNCGWRDSCCD